MLVADLLVHLTRIFFVLLAIITATDYLRHQDKIRRDISLVFLSLSANTIVGVFLAITGLQAPWLTKLAQLAVISQPYLLLRLVRYFRSVPPALQMGARVGLLISWVLLILFPNPLPPPVTLLIVVYFVGIDGYAVFAFIQGAFSAGGVTRHRLRFAAAGSALLALVLFVAGLRLLLPASWPDITPFVQFLSILSTLTYYLGFAPPRWLRQGWQFTELRAYLLQDMPKLDSRFSQNMLNRLRVAVTRAIGTNRVVVALWDEDSKKLVLQDTPESALLADFNLNAGGVIRNAWQGTGTRLVYKSAGLNTEDVRLMQAFDAEVLFIVPIATADRALGILLVFLEYGSLFVDDDLGLLTIFAQQTAIILENNIVLEQQRRYSEDLERKVQQRTGALQRSNEELRQFAYIASHDLQEPLRMVASYLQLIDQRYVDKLDNDAREFINFAVDGAVRMKGLIDGLLTYSRVETRQQDFNLVESQHMLDEACKLLKVMIDETGATITSDPLPKIMADEGLIIQLFQNLVSNGIKYQKDKKPEIHVSAMLKDREWIFSVRDNGIGIEAQYLDRIFVIFQRLHNRDEYPGTGIGLAVCKKVVEHHGGRIWVESEVGKGTTFFFTIPA